MLVVGDVLDLFLLFEAKEGRGGNGGHQRWSWLDGVTLVGLGDTFAGLEYPPASRSEAVVPGSSKFHLVSRSDARHDYLTSTLLVLTRWNGIIPTGPKQCNLAGRWCGWDLGAGKMWRHSRFENFRRWITWIVYYWLAGGDSMLLHPYTTYLGEFWSR